jgi:hypothetical protein
MEVKTILSPNFNKGRKLNGKPCGITRITPHCIVGQVSAETCAGWFSQKSRQASATYIIGKSGEVVYNVEEVNRPWTSSSPENDNQAITIECASDARAPYAFNGAVFHTLIELTADIIKRNQRDTLVWIPERDKALAYQVKDNEMLITLHRWFAAKECPGQWLIDHMQEYVDAVNAITQPKQVPGQSQASSGHGMYKVQVGAFRDRNNAEKLANELKGKGYSVWIQEV